MEQNQQYNAEFFENLAKGFESALANIGKEIAELKDDVMQQGMDKFAEERIGKRFEGLLEQFNQLLPAPAPTEDPGTGNNGTGNENTEEKTEA